MYPQEKDIEVTMLIEQEFQHALSVALSGLLMTGERVEVRHVLAAMSTFFTATLAVILPPDAWANVFDALKDAIPEMQAHRAQYEARRTEFQVPAPADPNAN